MKPFVQCIWHDAEDFKDGGWASEEEATAFNKQVCEVTSLGWLVSKGKVNITIAADFTPPITYGRLIKIPRKMIQSLVEVDITPKLIV
jgi:hypothetical protein